MKNEGKYSLTVKRLRANPRLTKLLPSYLARSYHAVPIAGSGNKITVAMADPSDSEARQAIMNAVGDRAYFVQGNGKASDDLLSEYWKEVDSRSSSLPYWLPDCSRADEIESYAQSLARLLKAVCRFPGGWCLHSWSDPLCQYQLRFILSAG